MVDFTYTLSKTWCEYHLEYTYEEGLVLKKQAVLISIGSPWTGTSDLRSRTILITSLCDAIQVKTMNHLVSTMYQAYSDVWQFPISTHFRWTLCTHNNYYSDIQKKLTTKKHPVYWYRQLVSAWMRDLHDKVMLRNVRLSNNKYSETVQTNREVTRQFIIAIYVFSIWHLLTLIRCNPHRGDGERKLGKSQPTLVTSPMK